jgi:hypothetical protein
MFLNQENRKSAGGVSSRCDIAISVEDGYVLVREISKSEA